MCLQPEHVNDSIVFGRSPFSDSSLANTSSPFFPSFTSTSSTNISDTLPVAIPIFGLFENFCFATSGSDVASLYPCVVNGFFSMQGKTDHHLSIYLSAKFIILVNAVG